MDEDPWDWSIEKVIQHVCQVGHLWTSIEGIDDPLLETLARRFQVREINGRSLLTHSCFDLLGDDFERVPLPKRSALALVVDRLRGCSVGWMAYSAQTLASESSIANPLNATEPALQTASPNVLQDAASPGMNAGPEDSYAISVPGKAKRRRVVPELVPASEGPASPRTILYGGKSGISSQDVIFGITKNTEPLNSDITSFEEDGGNLLIDERKTHDLNRLVIRGAIQRLLRAELEETAPTMVSLTPLPERFFPTTILQPAMLFRANDSGGVDATKQNAKDLPIIALTPSGMSLPQDSSGPTEIDRLAEQYPPTMDEGIRWQDLGDDEDIESISDLEDSRENEEGNLDHPESSNLHDEVVNDAVTEFLNDLEQEWENEKLPRLEAKASTVWMDARKGDKQVKLDLINKAILDQDKRLSKFKKAILDSKDWKKVDEVKKQCRSLQMTYTTILELRWEQEVICRPTRPVKVARVRALSKRRRSSFGDGNDDEIELDSELDESDDPHTEDEANEYRRTPLRNEDALMQPPEDTNVPQNGIESSLPEESAGLGQGDDTTVHLPVNNQTTISARSNFIPEGAAFVDLTDVPSSPPALNQTEEDDQKPPSQNVQGFEQLPEEASLDEIRAWDYSFLYRTGDSERILLKILMDMSIEDFVSFKTNFTKKRRSVGHFAKYMSRIFDLRQNQNGTQASAADSATPMYSTLADLFLQWLDPSKPLDRTDNPLVTRAGNIIKTSSKDNLVFRTFLTFLRINLEDGGVAVREDELETDSHAHSNRVKTEGRRTVGKDLREAAAQRDAEMKISSQRSVEETYTTNDTDLQQALIINPGFSSQESMLHVDEKLSEVLKPHQAEGVQFLWREIIMAGRESASGCVLAHTMGLGKTLQTIAFLHTFVRAASSTSSPIRNQIPDQLHTVTTCVHPRVLIICPPSLIQNWVDEFAKWVPQGSGLLSHVYKVESGGAAAAEEMKKRCSTISAWSATGGVLIIGYEILRNLLSPGKKETLLLPEGIKEMLTNNAAIVVADEAHKLKNSHSDVSKAVRMVESYSRIALTGSPLANNLSEYFRLVDWAIPEYLGTYDDFRHHYQNPIEDGTYANSSKSAHRRSVIKLRRLTDVLAPKVHRKTIETLRGELPMKTEFVLRVDLTNFQREVYRRIVEGIQEGNQGEMMSRTQLFYWIHLLALVNFHPDLISQKLVSQGAPPTSSKGSKNKAKSENNHSGEIPRENEDEDLDVAKISLPVVLKSQLLELLQNNPTSRGGTAKSFIIEKIAIESIHVGDKVLIFSQSLPILTCIRQDLTGLSSKHGFRVALLTGATKTSERPGICRAFNEGYFNIMLISTKAGGLGLNLQGANRVILADFDFNPIWEEQAVGRAYRIGQQKPVIVYHLLCGGTYEENLHQKVIFKKQLFQRAVNKHNTKPAATKITEFLFLPRDVEQQSLDPEKGKDSVLDSVINTKDFGGIRSIRTTDTLFEEELEMTAEDWKKAEEEENQDRLALQRRTLPPTWRPPVSLPVDRTPGQRPGVQQPPGMVSGGSVAQDGGEEASRGSAAISSPEPVAE